MRVSRAALPMLALAGLALTAAPAHAQAAETVGYILPGVATVAVVAAIALGDGTVIADPFLPTADLVALLRLRANQLGREVRPVA